MVCRAKVYKDRVREWNIKRKLSKDDVVALLRLSREAGPNGRAGQVYIRGQPVSWVKVDSYLKRKKTTAHSILAESNSSEVLPSHVELRMPKWTITTRSSTSLTQPGLSPVSNSSGSTPSSARNELLLASTQTQSATGPAEFEATTVESSQEYGELHGRENTSCDKPTLVSPTNRNHNLHIAESNFDHDDDLPYQGVLKHLAYPTSTVQEFAGHLIDPTKSPAMLDEWFGIYRKMSLSPQPSETPGSPGLIAMDASNSPLSLEQNTPEGRAHPQDHILHHTKDELHEDSPVNIDGLPAEGYPKNFLAWSINSWLLKNECRHDESQSAMRFAASIFGKMIACRHERCLTSLELLMALIESHGNLDFANDLLDRFKATALSMSGLPEKKSIILAIKFKSDIVCRLGTKNMSYPTALEQVYADFEQYWGADSPSTLVCLYNLGWYLAGDNDPVQLKKGEEILSRVRSTAERILEPNDPQTIMCLTTLVRVLYNLNRNFEALAVMSTAMDRIVKRFFDYHPYRLAALRRLSMFMQKVGGHDAEPILREVATKRLRVLGPGSGLTKSSMKELKTLLIKQGRNDDAENMLRDLVDAASRLECMDDDCRIY